MPVASIDAQVTGALVNESSIATFYYVDAWNGSDSNAGTYGSPFATINRAVSSAAAVIKSGVKIFVNPGTYREQITLPLNNTSNSGLLIIEATRPGEAIISGADNWSSGWVAQRDGITWVHSWPYFWGYGTSPWTGVGALGLRREVVSINGRLLVQALSTPLTTPGTFAVRDGHTIVVYPPTGTNMNAADIEVGVRSGLLYLPRGISNLVLRGLTFEYDITPINGNGRGALTINAADNLLIENCKVLYNNWVGISLSASKNITFHNTYADGNGEDGIKGYRVTNWLLNGSETTWNNWRSASGNLYGIDTAGMKVADIHGLALEGFTSSNNLAQGLWFDTDIANVAVLGSNLSFNLKSGVLIENSEGPIQIVSSLISYNRGLGVIGNAAHNVSIWNSTLYGNAVTQMQMTGADAAVSVKDFQTGQYYSVQSSDWTIAYDVIAAASANTSLFSSALKNSWRNFIATLWSNYNNWYEPATGAPMFYLGGSHSLVNWRWETGLDSSSTSDYVTPPVTH